MLNNISNESNNNSTYIRKIADTFKISFKEAKFIYPFLLEEPNETVLQNARLIYKIMEEYKIPEYIAKGITWKKYDYEIDIDDIYYSISKHAYNKKYKELGLDFIYAKKLYPFIRNGIPIDKAEEIFELRNRILSIINNKPIDLVRIMTLFNIKEELAQTILDICIHCRDNSPGILGDYGQMIKSYLLYSEDLKTEIVNGIQVKSKTDEGLYNLTRMIKNTFNKGNDDFTEKLYNESIRNQLVVTDIKFDEEEVSKFNSNGLYIYVDEMDAKDLNNEETMYHEATHFIDCVNGNEYEYYSECTNKVLELFEQIKKDLNDSTINNILNNSFIPNFIKREIKNNSNGYNLGMISTLIKHKYSQNKKNGLDYVNNEELRKKWKKEIDKKYLYDSKSDRELYFEQKIYYEKQKYTRLISCVQDIYDGLTNGKAYDWLKLSGHGKKYYSEKENGVTEFLAEIGEIYNADGIDVLEYELGKDLTREIIKIYKEFLQHENDVIIEIEHNNRKAK